MRPGEIDEIRKLPLFAAMLPENFDALFRGAYVQNFPPQIELIRENCSSSIISCEDFHSSCFLQFSFQLFIHQH